jgi:hypothetical protein
MFVPHGFSSWSDYGHFTLAREFAYVDSGQRVSVAKTTLEKVGHVLSFPVTTPFNFILKEIKNPLVILSLTVSLVALATLVFYPAELFLAATAVFPFLAYAEAWMFKLALFVGLEATIAGVGLRALGRVCNAQLVAAWQSHQIVPVHVGAKSLHG